MRAVNFTKMHGLGNDFVVINAINQTIDLSEEQIRFIADRHVGVGCDQLLLVEAPTRADTDFRYRIFNADGGEVEQCGNGARCFARFVRDNGLTDKDEISVETAGGIIRPRIESGGLVTVDMGMPNFQPASLPYQQDSRRTHYALPLADGSLTIGAVSMGNPHAVTRVDNVDTAPVALLGPQVSSHTHFPQGVNAGFMQIIDRGHIRLRVFERGAGETLACGTGACAAVAVGRDWGELDAKVVVELRGGTLTIEWQGGDTPVMMTGPATHVFEGQIIL